jgi:hypothetical protein
LGGIGIDGRVFAGIGVFSSVGLGVELGVRRVPDIRGVVDGGVTIAHITWGVGLRVAADDRVITTRSQEHEKGRGEVQMEIHPQSIV